MWPEPGLKAQNEDSRERKKDANVALGRENKTSGGMNTFPINYCLLPEVSNDVPEKKWQLAVSEGMWQDLELERALETQSKSQVLQKE